MEKLLYGIFLLIITAKAAIAGNVESFNSRLFDLLYFSRPFEKAAIHGGTWEGERGSSLSVVQNPASLGFAKKNEFSTFATVSQFKGETYGLKRIASGGGAANIKKIYERPLAQVYNGGICQIFNNEHMPGTFGFDIDYIGSDFTDNNKTKIEDYGFRFGIAYGLPLAENFSIGYGLTLLQDHWQWGVTWAKFSAGNMPSLVNYYVKSTGLSLRHRLGVQAKVGQQFRYGFDIDFGHGNTNNTWNDVHTGGGNGMIHYGVRGGFSYDIFKNTSIDFDMQAYRTLVEFGYHSNDITKNNLARWDATVFRTMVGLQYQVTRWLEVLGGYRYSQFNVEDLCGKHADNSYDTFSGGLRIALASNINILWNIEHSNIVPEGEITNAFAMQVTF